MVAESATIYSANAPSLWNPPASLLSQYRGSVFPYLLIVDTQLGHWEQAFLKLSTPTRSPIFQA